MTAVACTVITCHGPRVRLVDDELLTRPTVELKPWKIRHVLVELRVAATGQRR